MRHMLRKVKELDTTIEARMSMPFSHWAEMQSEITAESMPVFLPKGVDLNSLVEFVKKSRVTSIEERK
jgi:hypothetical protein